MVTDESGVTAMDGIEVSGTANPFLTSVGDGQPLVDTEGIPAIQKSYAAMVAAHSSQGGQPRFLIPDDNIEDFCGGLDSNSDNGKGREVGKDVQAIGVYSTINEENIYGSWMVIDRRRRTASRGKSVQVDTSRNGRGGSRINVFNDAIEEEETPGFVAT
ncbi:hypothetical protein V6N11_072916 [Hibiscus sabdariffa]|uniref:Uncharacterized protein n=1 Tax=Hibiscus sabdariffa TaxID=183260 RepID=A0ABR2P0E7_9ROSI